MSNHLYKRAAMVLQSDDTNNIYNLTADIFSLTSKDVAAVAAEVADEALGQHIQAIKQTVRSSSRQRPDSVKVGENVEIIRRLGLGKL